MGVFLAVLPVFDSHLHAGDELHLQGLGHLGEVHGPAQIIVIGQSQRAVPQITGAHQQVLHGGGPFLERIVAMAMEFGVHKKAVSSQLFGSVFRVWVKDVSILFISVVLAVMGQNPPAPFTKGGPSLRALW